MAPSASGRQSPRPTPVGQPLARWGTPVSDSCMVGCSSWRGSARTGRETSVEQRGAASGLRGGWVGNYWIDSAL